MTLNKSIVQRIGVIGAGFSGTAFAAAMHRLSERPVEIILFEKSQFGAGDAYRTPFAFHLLNVRTKDMSAFEEDALHFTEWVKTKALAHQHLDFTQPLEQQFAPRFLYSHYLHDLLESMKANAHPVNLQCISGEVIDVIPTEHHIDIILKDESRVSVDKVVFALGNNPASQFPFPIAKEMQCITNPWDYRAPNQIAKQDPVLIVGTGLSMIDTVLTLYHQQHEGPIYAISRRGLWPLPHKDSALPFTWEQDQSQHTLRSLTKAVRFLSKAHVNAGGDWRNVINALRLKVPGLWEATSTADKKRFLRHVMPYWNIHRHRVHEKIADLLQALMAKGQLNILSGRVLSVKDNHAEIVLRHEPCSTHLEIRWLINCLGPAQSISHLHQPLMQALLQRGIVTLDELNLGFLVAETGALKNASQATSKQFYALGPLRKGASWEAGAVPEIRKQCFDLARHLLQIY